MQKIYFIKGLDCANCAAKVERALNQLEQFSEVTVDFMGGKAYFSADSEEKMSSGIELAQQTIDRVEPGVVLTEKMKKTAKPKQQHDSCGCGHEHGEQAKHDSCGCGHEHGEEIEHGPNCLCGGDHCKFVKSEVKRQGMRFNANVRMIAQIAVSAVLLILAMTLPISATASFVIFVISYLLVGAQVLWTAIRNILRGQIFDENFLMAIATIGAFGIGDYSEGIGVMLLYQVGELFQSYAVNKSRKSITELMNIRPDYANVVIGGNTTRVSPEEVAIDDLILVKTGEKIPLDGVVVEGQSFVDTSALTGESVPRKVMVGNEVLSGCVNTQGLLTVRVTKEFGESTVSKILDTVEHASSKKANTENFITKFARYYTPLVVLSAVLLAVIPPLVIPTAEFADWFGRALKFLVISCPCALVISVPLGFFGGIGGASKMGVLIKGSNYLEALALVDTVVFDKTGTLTKGVFRVTECMPIGDMDKDSLLEIAAFGESYSNHPIAQSIVKSYGKEIDRTRIGEYAEISGYGIQVTVDGKQVLLGNEKLMKESELDVTTPINIGTVVHIAIDSVYQGYLLIADEIKEDAKDAIRDLRHAGIRNTVMLTGDSKVVGESVAKQIGLDQVYTELLPSDKVEKVEELLEQQGKNKKLAFVGDGINDAPVLARADVGIAMGGLGSDAAIEAADVVLMTDEPSKLAVAVAHSRRTLRIVKQNIWFALGVKAIFLLLSGFDAVTMWEAVIADVGVSMIAILNSVRALRVPKEDKK